MPDETSATTEALAAPATAAPEAAAPAPEQRIEITPESLSEVPPDARDAVLFGEVETPKPADEPPVTQPAAEVPKPADEPPAPPASEDEFTKNFRLHTDNKQFSAYLKALRAAAEVNPNVNPAEVARAVGYDAPIPGVSTEQPPETPAEPPAIAATRAELAEVEAKLDEAGATEGLVNPEIINLIKEQGRLNAKLGTLELRDSLAREAVKADVIREYPGANSDDSSLGAEIGRLHAAIHANEQHPDHGRIAADDYPRWITEQAARNVAARTAKEFGISEAQAMQAMRGKPIAEATGPAVTAPPANTTTTQARPVPRNVQVTAPGGRTAPAGTTLTTAQLREVAADPKARDAALGFGGNMIVR